MTNTATTAHCPSSSSSPSSRRAGRALTVAAGTAGALLIWTVNGPWAGAELAVRQGGAVREIGPADVTVTALIAGVAAWILLALLERTVRRSTRVFRVIASVVLLLSLAGPLAGGIGTGAKLALTGLHLTVGLALIIGLPGRCPVAGRGDR